VSLQPLKILRNSVVRPMGSHYDIPRGGGTVGTTTGNKKRIKRLVKRVNELEQRIDELEKLVEANNE